MFFRCHSCFFRILITKDCLPNYSHCPTCGKSVGIDNFASNFYILRKRFPKPYYAEADND